MSFQGMRTQFFKPKVVSEKPHNHSGGSEDSVRELEEISGRPRYT